MKNRILKTITYTTAIIFVLAVCMIDSYSIIPTIAALASGAWLALFALANN